MSIWRGGSEFRAWVPRRVGTAAAALALNAALGVALIEYFRMPVSLDSDDSVSTLLWLHVSAPRPKQAEPHERRTLRSMTSNRRVNEALSPVVPSAAPITSTARAPVDWWKEAERVVRDRARAAAPSNLESGRIDLHIESQRDAPAHHAGESYRDELGDEIVWVSDKCYIESDPPPPGTPPVLAAARVTLTICPGNSSAPRGDLFKDLPAYRKYHPDLP